ncbi:MORN repeat-containing protein, partial [Candidatus Electronema sp. TJ]|uniref:MORN repeat-containing protein n=1 Tax=Candidatus Electronema sp. TJ TaxID=3401573 RepID=UPI003AA8C51D
KHLLLFDSKGIKIGSNLLLLSRRKLLHDSRRFLFGTHLSQLGSIGLLFGKQPVDPENKRIMVIAMKYMMTAFLFCLSSAFAHAEDSGNTSAQGGWIADAKTGCKVWNPVPASDESITWSGECKDGNAEGKGTLEWYSHSELQSTITGVLHDGRCAQECAVKMKSGDSYTGEMKDNLPHGKGEITRADGSKYEGEFKDGERSGKGTLKFASGEVYSGEWKNGKMHGKGELSSTDGKHKYTGEFKDDVPHGPGVMIYEDGSKYEGEWSEGRRHGKGKYTAKDGSSQEETWENGQKK